ncbi:hypothetical protein K461DRAFT_78016 [Myriangium duriaei CBS 260.36]|uniref:Uncharacterized protein n=1 Tax=Myriangium duriaei CBS 260.36 TaxID=1168546 RepID=A0A9P4J8Y3_9PEZI|nr:hypothetical protein K461DRAFT_78016 [Myriangium duriaei CBS 260.36]
MAPNRHTDPVHKSSTPSSTPYLRIPSASHNHMPRSPVHSQPHFPFAPVLSPNPSLHHRIRPDPSAPSTAPCTCYSPTVHSTLTNPPFPTFPPTLLKSFSHGW